MSLPAAHNYLAKRMNPYNPYEPVGEKKERKKRLTMKERLVVEGVLAGKSHKKAVRDAGYGVDAIGKSKEIVRNLRPTIQNLMDRRGLDDNRLLDVLEKGLDAKRPILVPQGKGKSIINDVEDLPTAHKYLETGLKLKGHLKDSFVPPVDMPDGITITVTRQESITINKQE